MILLTQKSAFKTAQLKDSIGTIKEQAVLTREHHGMLIYSVVAQVNTNISIQDTITPRKVVRAIPPELEDKDLLHLQGSPLSSGGDGC